MTPSPSPRLNWLPWLILALLCLTGIRTVSHPDYWVHLLQADAMASAGVKGADDLAFIGNTLPQPRPTWVYDKLLALLHGAGGPGLVTLAHIVALGGALGLLLPGLIRRNGPTAVALGVLLFLWLMLPRFEPRATTAALLFPALFLFILPKRLPLPWRLGTLLPIQILWTNVHGDFLMGPLIALAFLVEEFVEFRKDPKVLLPVPAIATVAALLLVTLLNPWGPGLHAFVFSGGRQLAALNNPEVAPGLYGLLHTLSLFPDWNLYGKGPSPLAVNTTLALGALGLVSFREKLPLGITIVAVSGALLVVREYMLFRELFALCALPFLCLGLSSLGRGILTKVPAEHTRLASFGTAGLIAVVALLMSAGVVNNSYFLRLGHPSSFGLGIAEGTVPDRIGGLLAEDDAPDRILLAPRDGAYLIHTLGPGRAAIDARVRAHEPARFHDLFQALLRPQSEGAGPLASLRPDAVLVNLHDDFSTEVTYAWNKRGWAPVYMDGYYLLLLPAKQLGQPFAKKALARSLEELEQGITAYQARSGAPFYAPLPRRALGASRFFSLIGDHKQADAMQELLEYSAPWVRDLARIRGATKLQVGDYTESAFYLEIAAQRNPRDPGILELLVQAHEKADRKPEAAAARERLAELRKTLPTSP